MKLILQLRNLFPLFLALLILNTAWKQVWQHIAARGGTGVLAKFAGAALYQSG